MFRRYVDRQVSLPTSRQQLPDLPHSLIYDQIPVLDQRLEFPQISSGKRTISTGR